MSAACHLFDIDSIAVALVRLRPAHFTPEGLFNDFLKKFDIGNLLEVQEIHYISKYPALVRYPLHMRVYGYLYEFETGALHLAEKSCGNPKAACGVK